MIGFPGTSINIFPNISPFLKGAEIGFSYSNEDLSNFI